MCKQRLADFDSFAKLLVLSLGVLICGSIGWAQESTASLPGSSTSTSPVHTSSTNISKDIAPQNAKAHLLADLQVGSNLYKEGSQRETGTDLTLIPSYDLTEKMKLSAKGIISRDNSTSEGKQEGNTSISNVSVKLSFKGPIFEDLKTGYSLGGVAPTNEVSRKRDRLQGGATVGGTLDYTWKRLSLGYVVSLQRNFHEYTINAEGTPNIQYSLTQSSTQSIDLGSGWSLSAEELYRQGRTYRNFERQTFSATADINYALGTQWTVYAGVSNEGSVFKTNGTESNLDLYNENTSTVHLGLTFTN